ncbi:MAG: hypothetical protein EBR81_12145 [Proteobacteria bacterium]|nr:hypothetical protein [Pseudomonadota bacterium]
MRKDSLKKGAFFRGAGFNGAIVLSLKRSFPGTAVAASEEKVSATEANVAKAAIKRRRRKRRLSISFKREEAESRAGRLEGEQIEKSITEQILWNLNISLGALNQMSSLRVKELFCR